MTSTNHKWMLNAMAAPNPTKYAKNDKYKVKPKTQDWSEIGFRFVCAICCLFFACACGVLGCDADPGQPLPLHDGLHDCSCFGSTLEAQLLYKHNSN